MSTLTRLNVATTWIDQVMADIKAERGIVRNAWGVVQANVGQKVTFLTPP